MPFVYLTLQDPIKSESQFQVENAFHLLKFTRSKKSPGAFQMILNPRVGLTVHVKDHCFRWRCNQHQLAGWLVGFLVAWLVE